MADIFEIIIPSGIFWPIREILAYQQQLFNEEKLINHFFNQEPDRIAAQGSIPSQEQ